MLFVLRMSIREFRASWRRLVFFFVCVAVGVGAIVAIRSVIQSVRTGLMSEARSMIASDVLISTNRPWTTEVSAASATSAVAPTSSIARIASRPRRWCGRKGAQTRADGGARGVAAAIPLLRPRGPAGRAAFSHDLLRGRGALVRPELLTQLGTGSGGG